MPYVVVWQQARICTTPRSDERGEDQLTEEQCLRAWLRDVSGCNGTEAFTHKASFGPKPSVILLGLSVWVCLVSFLLSTFSSSGFLVGFEFWTLYTTGRFSTERPAKWKTGSAYGFKSSWQGKSTKRSPPAELCDSLSSRLTQPKSRSKRRSWKWRALILVFASINFFACLLK